MSNDDAPSTTINTDPYVPVDSDSNPLEWDGETAHIRGLLYEVGKHYTRNGVLQSLIRHRAVPLSNGKIAIENVQSVPFILGMIDDPRSIENPCPDSATRIMSYNTTAAATVPPTPSVAEIIQKTPKPDASTMGNFVMNPMMVQEHDGKLLRSLHHVFGHAEPSSELFDAANGSGITLIELLLDLAKNATPEDHAIAMAEHLRIVRTGITGALDVTKLKRFIKEYKHSLINVDPSLRPQDAAEVQMINLIAYRDADVSKLYRMDTRTSKPATLAAAA